MGHAHVLPRQVGDLCFNHSEAKLVQSNTTTPTSNASTVGSGIGADASSVSPSLSRNPQRWSISLWHSARRLGSMETRMNFYHYLLETLRTFIEQFLRHSNDRYFPHFLLMKTVRTIAPHQSPDEHFPAFRTIATQAPEPKRQAGNHTMRLLLFTGILITLGVGKAMADDFAACVARLQDAAVAAGVTRTVAAAALGHVQSDARVLALAQIQPEFKMPIWDYLGFLVDQQRIDDGRARMQQRAQMLRAASNTMASTVMSSRPSGGWKRTTATPQASTFCLKPWRRSSALGTGAQVSGVAN